MKGYCGLALLCLLGGCATNKPMARVNDFTVPQEMDSGYRVVGVDGGAAASKICAHGRNAFYPQISQIAQIFGKTEKETKDETI